MKTEDLIRYRRMYAAMEAALGTPWLLFVHYQPTSHEAEVRDLTDTSRQLRERTINHAFQPPNDEGFGL